MSSRFPKSGPAIQATLIREGREGRFTEMGRTKILGQEHARWTDEGKKGSEHDVDRPTPVTDKGSTVRNSRNNSEPGG